MNTSPPVAVSVPVELGARRYDVTVGRDLLERLSSSVPWPRDARTALVVTQPAVAAHHLGALRAGLDRTGLATEVVEVPDGERAKSLGVLGDLYDRCVALPMTRSDVVVALGGGVVGDLAGFLAATWNRGIAVVQVPTTVLSQVDAAIGGKTGINLPGGKNLVGAFHQPLAVVADVATTATLPDRVRVEGFGEVVKYGFSHDPAILDTLESAPDAARRGDLDLLEALTLRSVRVKADVVARDEREGGERAALNLGHTFGHALETLTGYDRLLHGEAVAVGLIVALEVGVRMRLTPAGLPDRARAVLAALGLPTTAPPVDPAAAWEVMARDKKARDGVRFVLLEDLARPVLRRVERTLVADAVAAVTAP